MEREQKPKLTPAQTDVYAYVAGYIEDNGYSPTLQEISEKLGISPQAVAKHLRGIRCAKMITYDSKKKWRNIVLIPDETPKQKKKILGIF